MPNVAGVGWEELVPTWGDRCARDPELESLCAGADIGFAVRGGASRVLFRVAGGRFLGAGVPDGARPAFEVSAAPSAWSRFLQAMPSPPYQSLFGMLMRVADTEIRGDELAFAQHAHIVRRVLEIAREAANGGATRPDPPADDSDGAEITGRYRTIDVGGRRQRLHYEESGAGRDLVFLHTAGADAAQFHHLMRDPRLAAHYRMVAPDLPWHGTSPPPDGAFPGSYALDTDTYAQTVLALVESLGLRDPIVCGASMAGEICLELAYRRPDALGGVVACEASDVVPGRQVRWARHPRVNQALFVPEWVDGLMAPQSPARYRREVWWGYSRGGFGAFHGDILFYSGDWDARERVPLIDTRRCPVVMLTGEYDYSCTPDMSRRTAERIPGAVFRVMPRLGHFPHAENPPLFAEHLLDAVRTITTETEPQP